MDRCDRCYGHGELSWNELTDVERSRWHEQWEAQVREAEDNDSVRYYMGFAESSAAWDKRDEEALNDGVMLMREMHLLPVMASTTPRLEPPWIALCGTRCIDATHAADGSLVRYGVHWTTDSDRELCVACEVKWTERLMENG
jgi:hypothetical protein